MPRKSTKVQHYVYYQEEVARSSFDREPSSDSLPALARWHSLIRRMSINMQRDEGTPLNEVMSGTALEPTEHERALMLNMPMPPAVDDNLPSMEEIAREGLRAAQLAELKTSYFEHPFSSDEEESIDSNDQVTERVEPVISNQDITAYSSGTHENSDPQGNKFHFSVYLKDLNFPTVHRRAQAQWGTAIEKIRFVTSMSLTSRGHNSHTPFTTLSLVPFCAPAFATPYIAILSRDEHGRKPVAITDSEIEQSSLQRLYVYRIELQYGEIKWVIKRSIIEFYNLHLTLKFKSGITGYIEPPPSFPDQLAHLANAALASIGITREEDEKDELWRDVNLKRRLALEQYLKALIQRSRLEVNYELCDFLEISAISIVKDMGWKGKEGYMEHKMNAASPSLTRFLRWSRWAKQWVLLRDSYIAFCKDISSTTPTDVLLFDKHFKVTRRHSHFASYHQTHITLLNSARRIELKCPTNRHMEEWIRSIEKVQAESPWVINHRFGSFAPVRENAKVKWFVDSQEYFYAVSEAILSAKSEIYIEDWWLSPELYLRRPPKGNEEYRIDRLLKRKACEGVMIYIVIYKNLSVALPLDSQHTRDWLQGIHPNIIVQRHANLTTSPLWAHHEKILVVDHRLAFVGGLDLCFGRYDTPEHELMDHSSDDETFLEVFPGQDYSNPRVKDFIKVSQYDIELIDKRCIPRMPWHDIQTAMVGPPARDVARHFIQRWNFVKATRAKDREDVPFLVPKGEYVAARDESKFRGTCRVQVVRSSAEWSQGIFREFSIYSAYMECISKAKHFVYIENQFFISATHPDDKLVKNKIAQAIVERIKRAYRERQKFRVIVVIPCAPGFEGDFTSADRRSMPLRSVAHFQYLSISRGGSSILEKLEEANIPAEQYIGFYSLRNWGRVSSNALNPSSPPVSNDQGDLSSRMSPVTPTSALPTSSGILSNGKYSIELKRGHSNHQSRNKRSKDHTVHPSRSGLHSVLDDTIRERFSGGNMSSELREERTEYVTEQVYVHSKLMIVDDKTVICGSANINDRSQLGNRDSEIAVVIEDTDMVPSIMNGQPYQAAREHLGMLSKPGDCILSETAAESSSTANAGQQSEMFGMDPLHDDFFFNQWDNIAKKNTEIYRTLFRCVPDDTVLTFDAHRKFVPDPARVRPGHIAHPWRMTNEEIQAKLAGIRGHLVTFPTQYLCQENMTASLVQEAVPPIVFT
ncbi:Phospholipase D1 [Apophysomyces ossiformis]|uniref:Phospholipase n=1 Tax=Apophysomyces ossiformis TaxID=679940 RepID=A0A8H7ERA7_9FUNG|nr:Phospholipase D1 [Apophysomyces ossiformis]